MGSISTSAARCVALRCVAFKYVYHPSDSNCVDQRKRSTSPSRSTKCSTVSWKYRRNRAGSERSYCIRCWYSPWSSRLAMMRWIQILGLRFLFFCATHVQQAAALNSNKFFVFVGHINSLIFLQKNVSIRFNALQRASTRVAARYGAFTRAQMQRNAQP